MYRNMRFCFILCLAFFLVFTIIGGCKSKHGSTIGGTKKIVNTATERLFEQIIGSDIKTAEGLLQKHPDLFTAKGKHGNTLLHYAIQSGRVDLLELLLSKGNCHNTTNDYGETALHVAVKKNKYDIARILLRHDATDANVMDCNGNSPLHSAVSVDIPNLKIVRLLLDNGANPNVRANEESDVPLYNPVIHNNHQLMRLLINKGADVNAKDAGGNPLLHIAVEDAVGWDSPVSSDIVIPTVRILLESGADIDALDNNGKPILYTAVHAFKPAIFNMLINKGAKINSQDSDGKTALHYAAEENHIRVIKFLLAHGADKRIRDKNNDPPFNLALFNRNEEAAGLLEF